MSDDQIPEQKSNLRVIEFDNSKKEEKNTTEANKMVSDMFKNLSERALQGDIEDFVITFKSSSRGVESMIGAGGGVHKFDFLGYIGMLELLKRRLMGILDQMSYAYEFERPRSQQPEKKNNEPEPLKPDSEPET